MASLKCFVCMKKVKNSYARKVIYKQLFNRTPSINDLHIRFDHELRTYCTTISLMSHLR